MDLQHNPFLFTNDPNFGNPVPGVYGGGQSGAAISVTSAGTYVKPTVLTVSADLTPENLPGPASGGRGVALGFYSGTGATQYSQNLFTGLVLDGAGNLNLVQDPNATGFFGSGSYMGTSVGYAGGTFDPTKIYRLTYTVDTTTAKITSLSLAGSTADYSAFYSPALFTTSATAYAGMYTSGAGDGIAGSTTS